MARLWSAPPDRSGDVALVWSSAFKWSAPRGLIPPEGGTPNSPKRHRASTTPARLPRWGPRLLAAALQTRLLKIKIPSPQPARKQQAGDGSFFPKGNFPVRPEHLCASVQKLQEHSGRSPGFNHSLRNDLHSGATARESHPLPYSSRFDAGHPNAF